MKSANYIYMTLGVILVHVFTLNVELVPKLALAILVLGSIVFTGQANALLRRSKQTGPVKVYVGESLESEDLKTKARNFQLGAIAWLSFAILAVINLP